jgi:hypothetical protein
MLLYPIFGKVKSSHLLFLFRVLEGGKVFIRGGGRVSIDDNKMCLFCLINNKVITSENLRRKANVVPKPAVRLHGNT